MKTLAELVDSSGPILTPHLATLVPCLLKASGELETPKLSYMSARLGAHTDAQEIIDSVRAEATKQNQSTETLAKVAKNTNFNTKNNYFTLQSNSFHCSFSVFVILICRLWKK